MEEIELFKGFSRVSTTRINSVCLHDARVSVSSETRDRLHRLALDAEMKDNCTGFHMARTGLLSSLLADKLGLKPEVVHQMYLAAPMHDIGKIAIPDSILLKPGPLTPDEFEIMKSHTVIGARIFQSFNDNTLRVAHSIALCHHEKWDGTGYPAGLKGNDIPIAGRIVALADAFDAMCSLRPYREPLPVSIACELIHKERGSHFDPFIVDTFFENLPLVREIQQRISPKPVIP